MTPFTSHTDLWFQYKISKLKLSGVRLHFAFSEAYLCCKNFIFNRPYQINLLADVLWNYVQSDLFVFENASSGTSCPNLENPISEF